MPWCQFGHYRSACERLRSRGVLEQSDSTKHMSHNQLSLRSAISRRRLAYTMSACLPVLAAVGISPAQQIPIRSRLMPWLRRAHEFDGILRRFQQHAGRPSTISFVPAPAWLLSHMHRLWRPMYQTDIRIIHHDRGVCGGAMMPILIHPNDYLG
jgi:hypothetical protein